jgi:hypothetical protein
VIARLAVFEGELLMDELPEPLTLPDCDLRDYPWMPLVVPQLLGSKAWSMCKRRPELAFYMLNLWMASWHNVPAASLEDDDELHCDLARCDPKVWPKVRGEVMRRWVKCSDGLLYHETVAHEANRAWAIKLAQRERTKAATEARARRMRERSDREHGAGGAGSQRDVDVTLNVTSNVTDDVTSNVTDDVTSTLGSPPDQTRPDQTRPDQERKEVVAAADATANSRGHRLPADWQPVDCKIARDRGLNVAETLAQFRDYWHAKAGRDGAKLDWEATWRNWCRNQRPPPISREKPKFSNGFAELLCGDDAPQQPTIASFFGVPDARH